MKIGLSEWAENQLSSRFEAEKVLIPDTEWKKPDVGRSLDCESFLPIECPFRDSHGLKRLNPTETILLIDRKRAVRLNCQHGSCRKKIARLNAEIRAAQWSAWYDNQIETAPPIRSEEQIKEQREKRERVRKAKAAVAKISAQPLALEELSRTSPQPVKDLTPDEMMKAHLGLFLPSDLLWVASKPTSVWSSCFRTTEGWLAQLPRASVFLSGSTYKNPEESRASANLKQTRFCVFEHDRFSKEQTAAILRHAEGEGMPLVAAVDSGKKSLHGWVLADGNLPRWKEFFLAVGFCSSSMRPTQPVRLAGGKRVEEDRPMAIQRLLYLNRKAVPWLN